MLEQFFLDDSPISSNTVSDKPATGKRRKAAQSTQMQDMEDDDDAYPLLSGKGKKAKLGIGYAGDAREDVSILCIQYSTRVTHTTFE